MQSRNGSTCSTLIGGQIPIQRKHILLRSKSLTRTCLCRQDRHGSSVLFQAQRAACSSRLPSPFPSLDHPTSCGHRNTIEMQTSRRNSLTLALTGPLRRSSYLGGVLLRGHHARPSDRECLPRAGMRHMTYIYSPNRPSAAVSCRSMIFDMRTVAPDVCTARA